MVNKIIHSEEGLWGRTMELSIDDEYLYFESTLGEEYGIGRILIKDLITKLEKNGVTITRNTISS